MANLISMLRALLACVVVSMLAYKTATVYWWAFFLTIIVIWMDGLDGYVARKLNETSKAGAVIDILGDRVVEVAYWIGFLALGWIPLWMPLVVVIRGIVVDGFRSVALEHGYTAFGSSSMMKSKVGVFLVSSRASRWLYAVFKAIAFALLILAYTPGLPTGFQGPIESLAYLSIDITLFFCIVRGLPVLAEARRFMFPASQNPTM